MALNKMNIVLADDDADDRMLFEEAINEIEIKTELSLFPDGKQLMDYLGHPSTKLPEIIFLDLNMPVKNGMQCLQEIRQHKALSHLCVAIYSTSSSEQDIEETFINGANIYINKPNSFGALKKAVDKVLRLNWQYHTSALNRDNFLLRL
ncbi:response regulator [Maribacter sp. TH_r10]|uniref:Response regulator n=1 Tax=Maribacter luteus TaxID=2594478 RepID=A0A6I2MQG8_9FLAO|nr:MULTISPECIES: response regulator [Maribacter]MDV7139545.1 response regulator [Maribacter sp. TH_r10]MRX64484.1 response regulator [Maribacter luteus]|tara:strand:- start:1208 stop:1654 length:447 start_codon:yes stop_codon:yes gene_type:complete